MKLKFLELEIAGFRAVVPSLKTLPAKEVLALMSITNNSMRQFTYATALLRSNISEELLDKFDLMDLDDTIKLVTQWISKSNPDSEN